MHNIGNTTRSKLIAGDYRLCEVVGPENRINRGINSVEESYLIGVREFHRAMKAIQGRAINPRRTRGHWYFNYPANSTLPDAEADPIDWPKLVKGILAVTKWTMTRLERELGLPHMTVSAYCSGRHRPRKEDTRKKLIDMAVACGVADKKGATLLKTQSE